MKAPVSLSSSPTSSSPSIQSLVSDIKNEIFRIMVDDGDGDDELHAFVSASAYEMAWLAMVPADNGPMFESCLNWILQNQHEEGFWGETNEEGLPPIDALTSTLACLLALHTWNSGHSHIQSGLNFMKSKAEIILKINYRNLPRWFVLAFPAMLELAESAGLHLDFPRGLTAILPDIFSKCRHILQTEGEDAGYINHPLHPTSDSEAIHQIVEQQMSSSVGWIQESPSDMARAYMATGNAHCLRYLRSLLQALPDGGVLAKYTGDGVLIKMLMVDHVQGLGLAEHFEEEIAQILRKIYENRKEHESEEEQSNLVPTKLFKDALAFRLLRAQGYDVNPGSFCWFLHEPETIALMEESSKQFISAMYSVYRATDLAFPGEHDLEGARAFAIKMLENSHAGNNDQNTLISKGLQNMIMYELDIPWSARLDRLYHRKWIEENRSSPLWTGNASFYRLSCLSNKKLAQLATQKFEHQQLTYNHELEELKRWSKKWRLSEMGFGREKTVYTYFAVAASSCLPCRSIMRLVIAKSAIIVTVADDFYDMHGSLSELENLTEAVKRWDGRGLQGHGKTIFDALNNFVNETATSCCHEEQDRKVLLSKLQQIWHETFVSWMVERTWSLTGYLPSTEEYLETGMISIAAHTVALPATSLLSQNGTLLHSDYHHITKLLMALCRLANDIQSYQKEQVDGKMNLVLLHLKENPNISLEDSIAYVEQIIEAKKKEFLQHIFMDNDMPRLCRQVHLSCMKVFQMFFNSGNLFDSETALLEDIRKAIYLPIDHEPISEPVLKPLPPIPSVEKKNKDKTSTINSFRISSQLHPILKRPISTSYIRQPLLKNSAAAAQVKVHIATKFNLGFV